MPTSTPITTTLLPLPTIPFTTLIEADHLSLSHLAASVLSPNISLPTRLSRLTNLITRLIRHDISEELVMRPAFITYLGAAGVEAAERDRGDHAELKGKLMGLHHRLGMVNGKGKEGEVDEEELIREVKGLAEEMGEHMREESGIVLPKFASLVGREVEVELGVRYARTLVLLPDVELWECGMRSRWFVGVEEYANADVVELRALMGRLEISAEREEDRGYLYRRVLEELGELRLLGDRSGSGKMRGKGGKL